MPYLTNADENELKRLRTTADVGILGDVELRAAKITRYSSIGNWGEEGMVGYGFELRGFFSFSSRYFSK